MTESEDKQIAEAKIAELEKCMLQIGESSLTGFSGLNFNPWKSPFLKQGSLVIINFFVEYQTM